MGTTVAQAEDEVTTPAAAPPADPPIEASAVVEQIEELLNQLRGVTDTPQTNRQRRSLDKTAKLRGDALLRVLGKIAKELVNIKLAIQRQGRKARRGKSSSIRKNQKGKSKKRKGKSKNKKNKGKKKKNRNGKARKGKKQRGKNKKKKGQNKKTNKAK